jgi:glycolate oxidase iron-sulfur subunit
MDSKSLPLLQIPPETYAKFNACVHCGLCLPACPTYVETLNEADSPRGRIHLMKAAVDGRIAPTDIVFEHLDRCLVCRACETACPSGVNYHALIEAVRPRIAEAALGKGKRLRSGMLQWVIANVLPRPKRVAASLWPLRVARKIGLGGVADRLMPGAGDMAQAAARRGAERFSELPTYTPARGERRGSVLLLRGCVGSVVSHGVNSACIEVVSQNGFDVHLLAEERCCGSLAQHANDDAGAKELAASLLDAIPEDVDFVLSPIAGCGAHLKSLDKVLADRPDSAAKAQRFVKRVRDISEFLVQVGLRPPPHGRGMAPIQRKVTYHDPCHLAHAQRITEAPRKLLGMVPGLEIVPLAESDMCCGAAGTYSLNQPELSSRLGARKIERILATGATQLVTANVGCALQIARHLRAAGADISVRHVIEVVAESYGGEN